ncbi:MAG: hypothetical protein H6993_02850 [Pseudomonadales bacterium]|nr:hypothetical protein [Pseudomonadales bacterium]
MSIPNATCQLVTVGIAAVLLSGCAGTFRTHVEPAGGYRGFVPDGCATDYDDNLCNEFTYAEDWITAYSEAGANPSRFRAAIAATALPAAAVAAFYGISGHGSADRVTRLTLGAATGYAFGTFFAPTGKQAVYFEGALAMSCVQASALPALVKKSDQKVVSDSLPKLEALLAELSSERGLNAEQAAILVNGKTMAKAGRDYLAFLTTAPFRLRTTINTIATRVNQMLMEQEPSLESLMSLAGSLNTIAGGLVVSTPTPSTGQDGQAATGLQQSLDPNAQQENERQANLNKKLDKINQLAERIRQQTQELADRRIAFDQINGCGANAQAPTLTVNPANAAMTVEVGGKLELEITDSTGFPSVSTSGAGIAASALTVRGSALVLQIEGKAATDAKGNTVTIRGASGAAVHAVTVVVSNANDNQQANDGGDEKNADPATPRNPLEEAAFNNPESILRLQCAIGMPKDEHDCIMGERTRKAMQAHKASEDGALSQALLDQMGKIQITGSCGGTGDKKARCNAAE